MKNNLLKLSASYLRALRIQLGTNPPRGGSAAQAVGREVLNSGLSTLDLARMHDQALVTLEPLYALARGRKVFIKRAGKFFAQVLIPLEEIHRTTRESLVELKRRAATLRDHAAALAKGNRVLQREVTKRKAGEAAVKKGKAHYQRLFVHSQVMEKKLRQLARQVLSAQEDERRVISRELHDEVVQTLVGINVELAALGSAASIGIKALKAKIARTQKLVGRSVSAVHQFARELRPAVLDDLGLVPAIHAYMKIVAARKKLKMKLTAFAGVETLDEVKRTVLYRVAQEALTNVARHAHATAVTMRITEAGGLIRMDIHDNGKSFQVLQTLSSRTNKRLGLVGMRERIEMVGGTLHIESTPIKGTTVRAEIPAMAAAGR